VTPLTASSRWENFLRRRIRSRPAQPVSGPPNMSPRTLHLGFDSRTPAIKGGPWTTDFLMRTGLDPHTLQKRRDS
jgi:hypothetical protein